MRIAVLQRMVNDAPTIYTNLLPIRAGHMVAKVTLNQYVPLLVWHAKPPNN